MGWSDEGGEEEEEGEGEEKECSSS